MSTDGEDAYNATYDPSERAGQMVVALLPKIAAVLSLFGSSMILYELSLDWRQGNARDKATSRILVSLSIADIFFAISWFLSTWPSPSDLTYIAFNVGNQATCTFQGFIGQIGFVSSPLFNVTLALFFLLRIRYRWSDFRLKRMAPWIQGGIWTFALTCSIYPIPLGLFNNAWEVCWLEPYPMNCKDDCTRGDNAWIHAVVFLVLPWVCVLCALIFMCVIYATVRQVEHRNTRYSVHAYSSDELQNTRHSGSSSFLGKSPFSTITTWRSSAVPHDRTTPTTDSAVKMPVHTSSSQQQEQQRGSEAINPPSSALQTMTTTPPQQERPRRILANHQRSDMVATQAMWYIAAFFMTYILDFISAIAWYAYDNTWWPWLDIFAYFFLPLQGFFNFCVFIRTRKMKSRLGQFARKVLCCLEGSNCCSVMMQKACCRNNDNTTVPPGGGCDKNTIVNRPCPAAVPSPSNNNMTDATRVSFASATGARSASPCRVPYNPCSKNNVTTEHVTPETNKFSVNSSDAVSIPTTNSRRLDDDQKSKTEVDTTR